MKKYLAITVTKHDGTTFRNPLKLSEANLISQLAQQNQSLSIRLVEVHPTDYKAIFG